MDQCEPEQWRHARPEDSQPGQGQVGLAKDWKLERAFNDQHGGGDKKDSRRHLTVGLSLGGDVVAGSAGVDRTETVAANCEQHGADSQRQFFGPLSEIIGHQNIDSGKPDQHSEDPLRGQLFSFNEDGGDQHGEKGNGGIQDRSQSRGNMFFAPGDEGKWDGHIKKADHSVDPPRLEVKLAFGDQEKEDETDCCEHDPKKNQPERAHFLKCDLDPQERRAPEQT